MKYVLIILSTILCSISSSPDLLRLVNDKDHINKINLKAKTWEAGHNDRFKDMNIKTVKKMLGALPTLPDMKSPLKKLEILRELPENFDLRERYPNCQSLKEVRDQSTCGSCWAFASVEAMSDRICISSDQRLQTRISAQNLLACCNTCGNGCFGGNPQVAWQYFAQNGLPTGGLYKDAHTCQPYQFAPCDHHVVGPFGPCSDQEFPTPQCSSECQSGYPKSFEDDLFQSLDAYTIEGEEQIKTELYLRGSVGAAFEVYEDFPNYKSGVYQHATGSYLGGHAIKMIGWGVENEVPYWLCVNSWNEGWGDKGTFKILRGKNHLNIEGEIVAGTVMVRSTNLKYLED